MTGRRMHGEGSIFQRADGVWIARISIEPGPNGKRRQRSRHARTKREALAKLKQLQRDVKELGDVDGPKRSVAEAVDDWISSKTFETDSTRELTEWRGRVIKTGLGATRTGDLTVVQCDRFLSMAAAGELGRQPIGSDGVRRIRNLLKDALRNEMRLGNLATNVADLSLIPATTRTNGGTPDEDGDDPASIRRTLSYDEYRNLWRIARYPLAVTLDLCGRNGLRPSEARGLRWDCVDLDAMTLRVDRQLNKKDVLVSTKTKRARRVIPIDETAAEVLSSWRRQQDALATKAGSRWRPDPAFVVSTRYGTPINSSNLRRAVTAVCEDAGVERIVPYELRHTAITFQCDAGSGPADVADWAGTSVRMVEEIYRHRLHAVAKLGPVEVPGLRP